MVISNVYGSFLKSETRTAEVWEGAGFVILFRLCIQFGGIEQAARLYFIAPIIQRYPHKL
jgi:hypothetical protein